MRLACGSRCPGETDSVCCDRKQAITPPARFFFSSRHCLLAEQPFDQVVAADFKMRGHVVKNSGQCSHFERVVIRNREMMLVVLAGAQPQMTARLSCDRISQAPQPVGKIPLPKHLLVISSYRRELCQPTLNRPGPRRVQNVTGLPSALFPRRSGNLPRRGPVAEGGPTSPLP